MIRILPIAVALALGLTTIATAKPAEQGERTDWTDPDVPDDRADPPPADPPSPPDLSDPTEPADPTEAQTVAVTVESRHETTIELPPTPPIHASPGDLIAHSPIPGNESGRTDDGDGDSALRYLFRAVLFVPKIAFIVAMSPIRGTVWANERYRFVDLYQRIFFNKALTIGLYPTASFESGFGVNAGARFVARDLFGEHERVSLGGSFGGEFRASASGSARTGSRLGRHFELGVDAELERRPHDPFYGIGNGDVTTAMPQAPL